MPVNDPTVDVQQTIATRLHAVVKLVCDEQSMAPARVQQLLSSLRAAFSSPVCGIPAMQALATLAQAFSKKQVHVNNARQQLMPHNPNTWMCSVWHGWLR